MKLKPNQLLDIAAALETGSPLDAETIASLCAFLRSEADRRAKFKYATPRKFESDQARYAHHNAQRKLKRKAGKTGPN